MDYRHVRLKPQRFSFKEGVIHEDEHLLCLNKPQGWLSIPDRTGQEKSLLELAKQQYADIQICHRLDRHTTGTLLFAKTPEAYKYISEQLEQRVAYKAYAALVAGSLEWEDVLAEFPLSKGMRNGRIKIDNTGGKEAYTYFSTLERFKHFTVLRAEPVTGRSHQIRVHASALNHPLVGDVLYGGADMYLSDFKRRYREAGKKKPHREEQPTNTEYVLHAYQLGVEHPATGEKVLFEAPPSPNLAVCLKLLRKWDALPASAG